MYVSQMKPAGRFCCGKKTYTLFSELARALSYRELNGQTCLIIDLKDKNRRRPVSLDPEIPRAHDSMTPNTNAIKPIPAIINAQKSASSSISSSGKTKT